MTDEGRDGGCGRQSGDGKEKPKTVAGSCAEAVERPGAATDGDEVELQINVLLDVLIQHLLIQFRRNPNRRTLKTAEKVTLSYNKWRFSFGDSLTYLQNLCCPTLGTRGHSSLRSMEWGSSLAISPVHPQGRLVHSRWLALPCGMDFRWRSDCSPGFIRTHSAPV